MCSIYIYIYIYILAENQPCGWDFQLVPVEGISGASGPTNLGPLAPNYAALNLFLPQQTMVWLRRVITHTHAQTYTHTVTHTHTCYCEIVWLRRDVTCYTLVTTRPTGGISS